jgi:hypothetical protein
MNPTHHTDSRRNRRINLVLLLLFVLIPYLYAVFTGTAGAVAKRGRIGLLP